MLYFCPVRLIKPRLAVLASRFPYPVEKGDKLRLYHQLKHLSSDFSIYLFALTEKQISPPDKAAVESICQQIFVYEDHHLYRKYRVVRNTGKGWPSQVHYFYSSKVRSDFLNDFFKVNADIVYCQLYRMAPYLQGIQAPKVLDVMDSFASIATLHAGYSRRWYDRMFWKHEHSLIRSYEKKLKNQFDHFTVISERDASALDFPDKDKVSIVQNGIDVDFFQSYPNAGKAPEYDIAFIGNLDYRPNREGVRYLIREILPLLQDKDQPVKILLGGKGADNIAKLYDDIPGVTYHDWYDDIREAYYSTRVFIVPLFLGSGMQNKVLEALACNRPVICSSHVIKGMPMLRDNVYIADRPEEFLDHYLKICEDGGYSDEQSGTLDVLRNNLTWEAQCAVLKDILHDTRTNYEWDIPRYH